MPRTASTLVILFLVGAAAAQSAVPTSQPAAPASSADLLGQSDDEIWFSADPNADVATRGDQPLERDNPQDSQAITTRGETPGSGWLRTAGALAAVVGLILLLMWGYRKVNGTALGTLGRARRAHLLEVVARTPLSPKQSVCLVRVGPRLVVVGASGDRLTALDVITDGTTVAQLLGESAAARPDSRTAEFERLLAAEHAEFADDDDERDLRRSLNEPQQPLSAAREALTGAIARVRARLRAG